MTKKDYITIANAFAGETLLASEPQRATLHATAMALALAFSKDNPRFDYDAFMIACKVRP